MDTFRGNSSGVKTFAAIENRPVPAGAGATTDTGKVYVVEFLREQYRVSVADAKDNHRVA